MRAGGLPVGGFVTEEIRETGVRVGFGIESATGRRATLAHVDLPGPPRVGKYGVDLPAFERVALPAMRDVAEGGAAVIDELGKMELASRDFREAVLALLARDVAVLATVHVYAHPFTDALKRRADVETIRVTAGNRDALPGELARRLGAA
jgi:nucleoside-triphosphatase